MIVGGWGAMVAPHEQGLLCLVQKQSVTGVELFECLMLRLHLPSTYMLANFKVDHAIASLQRAYIFNHLLDSSRDT